jgi:hypothetical protein
MSNYVANGLISVFNQGVIKNKQQINNCHDNVYKSKGKQTFSVELDYTKNISCF